MIITRCTFWWLVAWVLYGSPTVSFNSPVSDWAIALMVCGGLDLLRLFYRTLDEDDF